MLKRSRRGRMNTWKNCVKNILMNWITMIVSLSHSEPDILECEVRWALRSTAVNKASGCDEIPAELLKSLKMMPLRFCIHYVSKSGRLRSGHRTGKGQSSSQIPRREVLKNVLAIGQLHSPPMLVNLAC